MAERDYISENNQMEDDYWGMGDYWEVEEEKNEQEELAETGIDTETKNTNTHQQNFENINFKFLEDMPKTLAKSQGKPIFIFFTGYTCQNCLKFEQNILSDSRVSKVLKEKFLCFIAYVDDKSKIEGSTESRGMLQAKIQEEYFKSFGQPSLFV